MTRTKSPAAVRIAGVLVGLVVLGLIAVFAIALPKMSDPGAIDLPETLPGGYTAMDLEQAYAGLADAPEDQVAQARAQEQVNRAYAEKVLDEAYDVEIANRAYLKEDGSALVTVQAFRAPGGAFSPVQFTDPSSAQPGATVERLVVEGEAVCVVHGQLGEGGEVTPQYTQCQRSEADLTLQVTGSLDAEGVAEIIDELWSQVA